MVPDLNDDTARSHRRAECARCDGSGTQMRRWRRDNRCRGATAVEYALMVALIAVVIIAAVAFIGTSSSTQFQSVGDCVNDPGGCG